MLCNVPPPPHACHPLSCICLAPALHLPLQGVCECGRLAGVLTSLVRGLVVEGALADRMAGLALVGLPVAPYLLAAASSPFRPLLAPSYPPPDAGGL